MDARELRIGNYVTCLNQTREVLGITKHNGTNETVMHYAEFKGLFPMKLFHLKPIPLTEQWLLDFGFDEQLFIDEEEPCFNRFRLNSFYIERFNNENYFLSENIEQMIGGFDLKIKYVHELQNLYYALTKKELTLKANN